MQIESYVDAYKRQIKDIDKLLETSAFFNDDQELSFIIKKTSRLILALYVLFDRVNDREPLKWELRRSAVELLVTVTSSELAGERATPEADFEHSLDRLLRMLQTAAYLRFLSVSHFSILQNECRVVGELCRSYCRRGTASSGIYFPVEAGDERAERAGKGHENAPQKYKGHKGQYKGQSIDVSFKNSATVNDNVAATGRKQRRESIIRLLDSSSGITIKDISAVIRGCSEKTIQRELNELIGEGVIRREGERRWSAYFKAEKQGESPENIAP